MGSGSSGWAASACASVGTIAWTTDSVGSVRSALSTTPQIGSANLYAESTKLWSTEGASAEADTTSSEGGARTVHKIQSTILVEGYAGCPALPINSTVLPSANASVSPVTTSSTTNVSSVLRGRCTTPFGLAAE